MQQQKKDHPVKTNDPGLLNRIRLNVKKRFEEYRQILLKQQQEATAKMRQSVEVLYSTQARHITEIEKEVLAFVNGNDKNFPITAPGSYDPDTDFAKIEGQYNEMNYKEIDFSEAAMRYSTESAGQAMQYTEEGIEKAMEAISDNATEMEKIAGGMNC